MLRRQSNPIAPPTLWSAGTARREVARTRLAPNRYANRLASDSGITRSNCTIGPHGHHGTAARPGSRSMAATSHLTPVSLSTKNIVLCDFVVISDSMEPGSITDTLIGPLAYSARNDSPSELRPALLAA